ncbi:MAG: DUF3261 domain-containing protein [Spirochaetaceae bacterium]|jgi:hypothetical protein|nr:DUF3261 domain-containing protein [Spirochaetaceae bacterium]
MRPVLFSVVFLALFSCASSPRPAVSLTGAARYTLLDPAYLETPLDAPQEITGVYGSREITMRAWVLADAASVSMTFFDLFGVYLGELSFTEDGISFSFHKALPSSLKPEYIIADFQLCFYRIDALSRNLKAGGLSITESRSVDPNGNPAVTRVIYEGKKGKKGAPPLIEIEKTDTTVRYTNHARRYGFTVSNGSSMAAPSPTVPAWPPVVSERCNTLSGERAGCC